MSRAVQGHPRWTGHSGEFKSVSRKGSQPWIFIGRTDAKAEAQYFGHLMWRTNSLEETLMLGKIEGRGEGGDRGWDGWMTSQTQWIWIWASSGRWWKTGNPGLLQSTGSQRVRHNLVTEQQFPRVQFAFLSYFWAYWQRKDFSYSPIVF